MKTGKNKGFNLFYLVREKCNFKLKNLQIYQIEQENADYQSALNIVDVWAGQASAIVKTKKKRWPQ